MTHCRYLSSAISIALSFFATSSSFVLPVGTTFRQRIHRCETRILAKSGDSNNNNNNNVRRNLLGLAFPLAATLVAYSPFIAVMSNPPSAEERETMLTEWCQGEACTLLGGGAGYFDGAVVEGKYDPDLIMPSSEEYEEQARIAAERAASGED